MRNTSWRMDMLIKRVMKRLVLAGVLFGLVASSHAAVKLHGLFGSNMVLQRDARVPVWGTAEPGEHVTVSFCGQTVSAVADASGKWIAALNAMPAGGPFEMTVVGTVGAASTTNVLKNVAVGDVWVCSGQSNMQVMMKEVKNSSEEINAAKFPMVRLLTVPLHVQDTPVENIKEAGWAVALSNNVGSFSAVAYFFGRDLNQALNIPIGLVNSSWGGSCAESWTTRESLLADPDLRPLFETSRVQLMDYAKKVNKAAEVTGPWMAAVEKAKADGKLAPPLPVFEAIPNNPAESWGFASSRYSGMIAPLIRFPIRGAIWYQGESNEGRAWQYRKLLPAMIADWRKAWGQGDFPFYIVQLANFGPAPVVPSESAWAELREAQSLTARNVPNCGQAVAIDIGDAKDIHPKNKQDAGKRLSLIARAQAYGEKIVSSGPVYESMKVDGNHVVLNFKEVGGGLVAKGGALKQFAIAGADKKFVWADAVITGNTVVVSSASVTNPVAVRYAWAGNPEGCNLYNTEDLPASPFRTDDWPMITYGKR